MRKTHPLREEWEKHVRAEASRLGGPCVLDANADNMQKYAQGSFELVKKDLAILDDQAEISAVCAACEAVGVLDAFAVRRELINYKKVCLHMMHRIQGTERKLSRLATFYFRDVQVAEIKRGESRKAGEFEHGERYTALAKALQRCRGLLLAVRDARDLAKSICCVPRQPCYAAASVPKLSGLPRTLAMSKAMDSARIFLVVGPDGEGVGDLDSGNELPARSVDIDAACSGGQSPGAAAAGETLALLVLSLRDALEWPEHVADFVRAALVARGAAKALAVAAELRRAIWAVRMVLGELQEQKQDLENLTRQQGGGGSGDGLAEKCFHHADRHQNIIGNCADGVTDVSKWLSLISKVKDTSVQTASDGDTASTSRAICAGGCGETLETRVRTWIAKHNGDLHARWAELGAEFGMTSAQAVPGEDDEAAGARIEPKSPVNTTKTHLF